MKEVDCELACKECGSTENLAAYYPKYEFTSMSRIAPAYCKCAACEEKMRKHIAREESMKYYVIDDNQSENKLCDGSSEVEDFLEYYDDSDCDSGSIDGVIILKLEPLEDKLKASDFKPQRIFQDGEFINQQEPNTHIVIIDDEIFRVEDIRIPEIEYNGGRSINW